MPSLSYETWSKTEGRAVIDCLVILPDPLYDLAIVAVRTAYLAGQKSVETDIVNDIPRQRQETIEAMHELVNSVMRGPK